MPNAFEVESLILSDYFTQDINGKSILAGIYGSELVFAALPQVMPLLIFTVTLKPVENLFEAEIKFSGPNTKPLVVFDTSFSVQGQPNQFTRVIFNIQLPYLHFDGPGTYTIEVGAKGKKPHYRKQLNFVVGTGSVALPGTVSVGLRYIAESATVKFNGSSIA